MLRRCMIRRSSRCEDLVVNINKQTNKQTNKPMVNLSNVISVGSIVRLPKDAEVFKISPTASTTYAPFVERIAKVSSFDNGLVKVDLAKPQGIHSTFWIAAEHLDLLFA
jgi:hypothetical protein